MLRFFLKLAGIFAGLAACGVLLVGLALALAYPNLPDLDALTNYHPKVPLRVFTADNVLIGEFGEERRNVVRINEVPDVLKSAILSAEDDRFYQHGGIDWAGVTRAALTNLVNLEKSQGASTITMQVARNFYLSSEKTYTRKLYEILLTFKIEASLTKDQILELYINQIYLGQRSYGFASAARIYFGKPLSEISTAEAAMLAGIPKAPSRYNPVVNPTRAKLRQQYILQRMNNLGYLTADEYRVAAAEVVKNKPLGGEFAVHAEYVAELARQLVYDIYKEETYSRGLNVYTTVLKDHQDAAYASVREGILDYERRHGYRGPDAFVDLPDGLEKNPEKFNEFIDDALNDHPDNDNLVAAVVLSADSKKVVAARSSNDIIEITGSGLKFAAASLTDKAQPAKKIRRGAIVRLLNNGKTGWEILQAPAVQAAFVSTDPTDGAIKAMVGGFDFSRGKFNRVTQAWRQPGSSFKPFIYAASLEKGLTPSTVISDSPFVLEASQTGSQRWEPKNYGGDYGEPLTMKSALAKSKNMVSIRILQAIGPKYAQDFVGRFGFDPARHPAYLTMALGAGQVTLLQEAGAYSVFANGGYRVTPFLIDKVTDSSGRVLMQARPPKAGDESVRAIDARTAFVADTMLRNNVRTGTANRAMSLKRNDVGGKTGTTNDSVDAWFAGYTPALVGIAWMGYDQPKSLGSRETGGGAAMPIWLDYMQKALKGVPEREQKPPPGLKFVNGDYYFDEFPPGQAIASIGVPKPAEDPLSNLIDSWGNTSGNRQALPPSQDFPPAGSNRPWGTSGQVTP
ncbi:penicillin-binding protein 1A [Pigmentiphaga aceris]|uniref:Penicillin-binding protein 1A n=1 Tax=Pigmentiphaga aceris TaxID=1940612 RepID=A0A5C0B442_9BURK|nr:penicillin-binding protein 1A [Pigmentiphaga aceris]QEI08704.1 penicillin-binding protein 1A [Pigmentiphaga aceris]